MGMGGNVKRPFYRSLQDAAEALGGTKHGDSKKSRSRPLPTDSAQASEQLNVERYDHRQRNIKKHSYGATPEGVAIGAASGLLQMLIDILADKVPNKPPPVPPPELNERLGRAAVGDTTRHVALAILAPAFDIIARGLPLKKKQTDRADNWRMLLAKQMGELLRDWLVSVDRKAIADYDALLGECTKKGRQPPAPPPAWLKLKEAERLEATTGALLIPRNRRGRPSPWKFLHDDCSSAECVVAGDWMLSVLLLLPCFDSDKDGIWIVPKWQDRIDKICEDLLWRHPVMLPHREEPKPATGWWTHHSERLRTSFVRDWRKETREAIEARFATANPPAEPSGPFAELADATLCLPFTHADGVNALKRVPLRINQSLLPLIDKFAVELMGHNGDQRTADRNTVKADLRHARWCGNGAIHLDYSCDKRGRVYSEQQLNYAREDHVRGLFEFERGEPLGEDGLFWLEVHAANCGPGNVDKLPWNERRRWVKDHIDLIERVAADPYGSFDLWRNADKQFAFVAACMELSRGRKDPAGLVTHLPISFDGACNGVQHLALLSRDEKAARLVNLTAKNVRPLDIYLVVTRDVMRMLEDEDQRLLLEDKSNEWCFEWWRNRLSGLKERQLRKLLKSPVMTYAYSVTTAGMADKIDEVYRDLFNNNEPRRAASMFLAKAVRLACESRLKGPTRIMEYVRKLAEHRFDQGQFLEWYSPTGFPVANRYQEPHVIHFELDHGIRSQYTVAVGAEPTMMKEKILDAASPNFVHSLDAAHLIRTVLAANSEGIRDILTVHDSYSCLAPHARRFNQIIRREMALLYIAGDPLRALRAANVKDPNLLRLPRRGKLDLIAVQYGEYEFM